MVAQVLSAFYVLAAAGKDSVRRISQLLRDDGGHDFTALIPEHHPLLGRQEFLLFGEHVHDANLVVDIIALVLGVTIMPD